jgi:hypothetical protein
VPKLLPALVLVPTLAQAFSSVPPPGMANDPGASNCQSCHDTFGLGSGDVTLSLADSVTMAPFSAYAPGEVYQLGMEIRSGESGRNRWGFQSVPLDGTNAMAGSLTAGPGTGVQAGAGGRSYVNHVNAPTGPAGAGWTFTWTAPATDVGVVTFHACGNAANFDGRNDDDFIECVTFTVTPSVGPIDTDGDGLTDADEAMIGTDPMNPDSDGDGLGDGQEVNDTLTDPLDPDTDADGLTDGREVTTELTDPLDLDSDDDGLSDGEEADVLLTSPLDCDSDGDGLVDGLEAGLVAGDVVEDPDGPGPLLGTDLAAACPDTGGPAFVEDADPLSTTDPLLANTDGDDCDDGAEDSNGNGAVDAGETDPEDPGDCLLGGAGLLQLVRTLDQPPLQAGDVFATAPCTVTGADLRICAEAPGAHESSPDPAFPFAVAGDGVLVFIEYDSDTGTDGTADLIGVRKDPAAPGGLLVELR